MNLRVAGQAIRKYWWITLAAVVLGLAAGVAATVFTPSQYASTVTFFVRTPADQIGGAYQGDQFAQKRVNSYVQLAESQRLADLVKSDTQLDLTSEQIQSRITAKGDVNTVLLTLTVTDPDPARSLDLAQSVSTQFVDLVSQLETPPGSQSPTVSLEVTSNATLQTTPVSPRPLLNAALGLLAGAVLGVGLAMLIELTDRSIRTNETLRHVSGGPVLSTIPYDDTAKSAPLIVQGHAHSKRAEAYRQLRTNLQFVDVDNPAKIIVVTSSVPAEGKSSTATNLAVTFAEAGKRVLLIEADLRRPRVAEYLGIEGSVGLTNVLAGQVPVDEVLQTWGTGGLSVLPSGTVPPNPSELLGSDNMRELLSSLRRVFEIIIIDTPPLLPVTDGAIAAASSDGAIVVVKYGKTTQSQLAHAMSALNAVGARVFGTVMSMAPLKGASAYGYGYGYDYESESTQRPGAEHGGAQPAGDVTAHDQSSTGETSAGARVPLQVRLEAQPRHQSVDGISSQRS